MAGMTHLHCIAHAGICTLQSYHPDITYKPLMVDEVALIGPYIRDLLRQEPTLSLGAARSPLVYDLSYSLEAILYGHTLDGVIQDWCTNFSQNLHQDIHMTFVSNPVSYLLSQLQSLHGPGVVACCPHGCLGLFPSL